MIVTCPSCQTHFTVSEAAFGPRGRTVRCARCSHKWHQDPPANRDDVPLEMAPAETEDGDLSDHRDDFGIDTRENAAFDFAPVEGEAQVAQRDQESDEDPFAKISELMMSSTPEPIPDVFASSPPKPASRRKGAAGLWLLLLVLLTGSAGAGLYFLQDRVIDQWPEAARYYDELGVRNEVVGAGLTFRNYNSERLVQDSNEVLIVRGVIANTSEQPRDVPLLRLALYNNQTLLQEKVISPPQTTLEGRATVGFRITLDQPDPNASRFEVTFTAAKPPAK